MDTKELHPLHACWDLAASAVRAEALDTALALGLFEELHEPLIASELAARCSLHPDNTAHLLELLWSMGLLERNRETGDDRYGLTAVTRDYLLRDARRFCGEAWRYRLASLRRMGEHLGAQVKHGPALPPGAFQSATGTGWAAAARAQIGQEQRAVSVAAAMEIFDRIPEAAQARRLLDLGGGPGWIAIELARRFPDLCGVVLDWPETAAVAQENIARCALADRVAARGCDLGRDSLGEGFDLVWCSSVLHFVPDVAALLEKLMAAMVPGGTFVCVHAELAPQAHDAAQVMPFYLPMRMMGRHVLPEGGTARAMAAAGFVDLQQFGSGQFPMSPVQVVVARKPSQAVMETTHA